MPEMPQMPQMPQQGPPQPTYNTREDGYVALADDAVVAWTRIYSTFFSFYKSLIDSQSTHILNSSSELVSVQLGYFYAFQLEMSTAYSILGRLGHVLAKGKSNIYRNHDNYFYLVLRQSRSADCFIVKCSSAA